MTDDPERCWRNVPAWRHHTRQCPNPGTGPAGLCDDHRNQMRTWGNTTPTVLADRPAAHAWLDRLDHQLDRALEAA